MLIWNRWRQRLLRRNRRVELVALEADKLIGMTLTQLDRFIWVRAVGGDHLDCSDVGEYVAVPTLCPEVFCGDFDWREVAGHPLLEA